jgi:hypothetical protein
MNIIVFFFAFECFPQETGPQETAKAFWLGVDAAFNEPVKRGERKRKQGEKRKERYRRRGGVRRRRCLYLVHRTREDEQTCQTIVNGPTNK